MYWDQRFPRLITREQLRNLVLAKKSRLLGIGDVTCDMEGSIEFLTHYTTPDAHFWVYNPVTEKIIHDIEYPSEGCILYDSLDFLPCELAFDASNIMIFIQKFFFFSKLILIQLFSLFKKKNII